MTLATIKLTPRHSGANVLRVLHVRTVSGNGGGPEKTVLNSARYLQPQGVEAEALYLLDARADSSALLQRAKDSVMPVHVVQERSSLDPAGAGALARLVRNGGFDIVHTHDYKSNTLARVLQPTGRYRIVATAHGYNRTTRREGCYYALERMLLRRADAVICPSHDLAELLIDSGVSSARIHVVHNGIELSRWPFRPRLTPAEALRVLYVGRLSAEKNVTNLLAACGILHRQGRRLRLKVAGDGPEADRLANQVTRLRLEAHVEWLGLRNDVPDLLAETDVFVNPSDTEAMPNTVLEALASGAPVVATDVGATRDLVLDGATGLLVDPGNAEALAEAIASVQDDPSEALQRALRGRSHIEQHFSFEVRMAHIVALYRGVIAAARRW